MAEPLAADFAPVTLEQWREKVGDKAADGVPVTVLEDGIEVPWLLTRGSMASSDPGGTPGHAPFVRGRVPGTAWDIRQEHVLPHAGAILEDLEGGATSIALRFDEDARDGAREAPVATAAELDAALDGVLLDLAPVALDAGSHGIEAAALLVAVSRARGQEGDVPLSLGLDPLGTLARDGLLLGRPEEAIADAASVAAELGRGSVLRADTSAYAEAGATAALELAVLVATATTYLRACEDAGLDAADGAASIELCVSVGADQFMAIAKLRAARRMWARVLELSGVEADGRRSPLFARTSPRMLAAVDPWVNMLRTTTATFAAAVGGADGITVTPFDAPRGLPSALGRRIARNTQIVLAEESHLTKVADPAGGAWHVEALTDQLARAGWDRLREIEKAGGMLAALRDGSVAGAIATAGASRAREVAHRTRLLTGVNAFPLLGDDRVTADPAPDEPAPPRRDERPGLSAHSFADLVALAADGAALADLAAARGRTPTTWLPFADRRDARPFEALREHAERTGPTVLLACVGPLARHNPAATWARYFFACGGIADDTSDAIASVGDVPASGPVACVCAARDEDPELLGAVVEALRGAGAQRVYVAGADCDAADQRLEDGVDMVAVLGQTLELCGVDLTEAAA